MDDTSLDASRRQARLLADLTPARKVHLLCEANRTARSLVLAGLRDRHPDLSEEELQRKRVELFVGRELARAAFLEDPPESG